MLQYVTIAAACVIMLASAGQSAQSAQPGAACPAKESEKGFLLKSVLVRGQERRYVVYVPPGYDPAEPTPTILFLHGMGESGTDGVKQIAIGLGMSVLRDVDRWPFIIIFPQKRTAEALWDTEDAHLTAVLNKTRRELNVDESRIYLTGLSQGGHGTWAIAARHPETFVAIAPICGWGEKWMAKKLADTPAWIFHGDADNVVTPMGSTGMADFLRAAGGSPKLTMYPGVGHNSWDKAYGEEDLPEWFLEHMK